ncbi:hypothetical protein SODALDRAFT_330327 [Sodiomyces alkalinus F11]|uniref:Uncharacterized protein n=1 Tax=Sodiomyces alkalinus (strain CBS 110278 / VKM F-3762 / F11) TaxID=1314773 RepID=A0A3N2Q1G3_SODAK|nr:hypothetical protein SODALDRAFT_330327 [Sodiomyces alkalinus F11]ROT40590.1 hypothetical protein SODALDRAFT_330327 [Sodiomyces alkalinus F11]
MVSTAGTIVIAIVVAAVVASAAWVVYTQLRARRLGLPPPSFTSYVPFLKRSSPSGSGGGGGGGISGFFRSLRNPRSAPGAYEEPLQGSSRARRGFGPLDPDEAWDSRVGYEADTYGPYGAYEEQELRTTTGGRQDVETGYSGAAAGDVGAESYDMNLPRDVERGRTGPRQGQVGRNPFDDDAEASNISLRGVSPRPIDTGADNRPGGGNGDGESPTERRSMFKENV